MGIFGRVAKKRRREIGYEVPLWFSLGTHSKVCDNQCDLPSHIPFFHPMHLSLPGRVHDFESLQSRHAVSKEKSPYPVDLKKRPVLKGMRNSDPGGNWFRFLSFSHSSLS